MSQPPENPRPEGGDPESPDPQASGTPTTAETSAADGGPDRPPPYQGTYGGQTEQPQPGFAPPGPAQAGQPLPAYVPPVQPYPGLGDQRVTLAGRWARLGAGLLDGLLLAIVTAPSVLFAVRWDKLKDSIDSGEPISDPMDMYNIPRLMVGYVIAFLLGFVYYTVLQAKWGQTLGKKAAGIRLVSADGHTAVTWRQVIGRQAFVYAVTLVTSVANLLAPALGVLGLIGLLDVAWILWDKKRQAVHDKVAGTVVVKATPWTPNPYARATDPGNSPPIS
ncbi:hypothetical protein GCM10022254_05080 [Actinomadura meridiana]|uniref:RDD domain-containing protein n=1 Tax=Actinomadura meridiana TaxID=559626 RepID=A0ABP8BSV1_9ACTN